MSLYALYLTEARHFTSIIPGRARRGNDHSWTAIRLLFVMIHAKYQETPLTPTSLPHTEHVAIDIAAYTCIQYCDL